MPELTEAETRSKRRAILDAARTLIAKQGYEETTIAQIASAAGVAVGTVYLYFSNKRDIYTSLATSWVESIAEVIQNPRILELPIEQIPRAMIEAAFRISHEKNELMPVFQVDIQSSEEIYKHKAAEESIVNALDSFFRITIERGQLAPFDTRIYAKILFNLVHSILFEAFCLNEGKQEEHYREGTIEFVERLFFGPPLAAHYINS